MALILLVQAWRIRLLEQHHWLHEPGTRTQHGASEAIQHSHIESAYTCTDTRARTQITLLIQISFCLFSPLSNTPQQPELRRGVWAAASMAHMMSTNLQWAFSHAWQWPGIASLVWCLYIILAKISVSCSIYSTILEYAGPIKISVCSFFLPSRALSWPIHTCKLTCHMRFCH